MSSSASEPPPSRVWIYHERQESLLCGQHALNNLLQQGPILGADTLAQVAQQLDALELKYMADNNEGGVHSKEYRQRLQEGSSNVDERGNFSIQVLQQCMDNYFGNTTCSLPHYTPALLKRLGLTDVTQVSGFLCHKSDHWFAIRNCGGRFFNLNSTLSQPVAVSHFQLGTEMQQFESQGYTVFAVAVPNLPPCHVGDEPPPSSPDGTYHNMAELLSGKKNTANSDPWKSLTGSGMRLDGGQTANGNHAAAAADAMAVEGLTEEEQLQLALQLSAAAEQEQKQQNATTTSAADDDNVTVPPEPDAAAPNACRIQFRFSDNRRPVVRRFDKSTAVAVLYAYCQAQAPQAQRVELRAGFPPRDLQPQRSQTLQQAQLASGESIQVRIVP